MNNNSYLSHCCMILISLMISWRSVSTGTCLIARTSPDSLCKALKTDPYALKSKIKQFFATVRNYPKEVVNLKAKN